MSEPLHQKAYQPLGDLWIEYPKMEKVSNYQRWLDLDQGAVKKLYRNGDGGLREEVIASHPDRVIVVMLVAQGQKPIDCVIRMTTPHQWDYLRDVGSSQNDGNRIVLGGAVEESGIRFRAIAHVDTDGGKVTAERDGLHVMGSE